MFEVIAPTRTADVLMNPASAKRTAVDWLRRQGAFVQGPDARPLPRVMVLHGPSGVGKRALVRAFCAEFGFDLREPDDVESLPRLLVRVQEGVLAYTPRPTVWLFTGVDGFMEKELKPRRAKKRVGGAGDESPSFFDSGDGDGDGEGEEVDGGGPEEAGGGRRGRGAGGRRCGKWGPGAVNTIMKLLSAAKVDTLPRLVFTVHDFPTASMQTLKSDPGVLVVRCKRIDMGPLQTFLTSRVEHLRSAPPEMVTSIVLSADGDVRQALIMAQLGRATNADKEETMFDAVRGILHMDGDDLKPEHLYARAVTHPNSLYYVRENMYAGLKHDNAHENAGITAACDAAAALSESLALADVWHGSSRPSGPQRQAFTSSAMMVLYNTPRAASAGIEVKAKRAPWRVKAKAFATARDLVDDSAAFMWTTLELRERLEAAKAEYLDAQSKGRLKQPTPAQVESRKRYRSGPPEDPDVRDQPLCRDGALALRDPFYFMSGIRSTALSMFTPL